MPGPLALGPLLLRFRARRWHQGSGGVYRCGGEAKPLADRPVAARPAAGAAATEKCGELQSLGWGTATDLRHVKAINGYNTLL